MQGVISTKEITFSHNQAPLTGASNPIIIKKLQDSGW